MKKILFWVCVVIILPVLVIFLVHRSTPKAPAIPPVNVDIPQVKYDAPVPVDARKTTLEEFFSKRNMPMAKYADIFIVAADTYGNDWRLLPAISVRESSGGKEQCGNNPFGWDSCRGYNFTAVEEAITYVSWRLAESPIYAGKTDYEKLQLYNPPSVVEFYADQVLAIMQSIQRDEN